MKVTWENLKPGTKVKCVAVKIGDRCGATAVIKEITADCWGHHIHVVWDDKCQYYLQWGMPTSFEIIGDDNVPKAVSDYELYHGGVSVQM